MTVPAGDGVRGGIELRTKLVDIFATDGGVCARIAPLEPAIFVVTPAIDTNAEKKEILETFSIKLFICPLLC